MNYLAHLYLAEDSPESILGNLLGDFLKGWRADNYCEPIRKGIQLHRKVDLYTDLHLIVRDSKRLISPVNQRYAGIIVDVFYDHFLAKDWSDYSPISLQSFTSKVYDILQKNEAILPDSLRNYLPNIIHRNLLMSYAEISGIKFALQRISARLKRENQLESASEDLLTNYECFELNFRQFFPELISYVKTLR
jgi:acyl carrier protein phosphodiesterase